MQLDLESAQLAKERLETDNLALYSKIKYLQSYGGSAGSGGAGGMSYKSPQVSGTINSILIMSLPLVLHL